MKKIFILVTVTLLSLLLFSCGKSASDCNSNHTGSVLIHNNGAYMPDGSTADFYLGSTKIASVVKGSEVTVDNVPIGPFTVAVKIGADTIYVENDAHFILDTVKQCATLHYYTDRYNPASDKRLKKNIIPVADALFNISKLNIYSYEYEAPKGYTGFLPDGLHYGFMAQELKNVYPAFVQLNKDGYYSVNYQEMIPILAKGIQEQQTQIDDLKKEVAELKSMIKQQQTFASK